MQILFRGGHGLGVWDIEPHMTLAQWFSGGKRGGCLDGYFSTIGGRILNSEAEICNLGLGRLSEVVCHRRLLGGCFTGMGQGGCVPGTGEFGQWTVGVRGTVATDAGVFVILMWLELGKCTLVGKRGRWCGWFPWPRGRGWDEWCSIGGCSWGGSDVYFDWESFIQEEQW